MKRSTLPAAAGLSVALVMLASSQAAVAATFVGGTGDWTFVGAPKVSNLGVAPAAASTFVNHLDVPVLAVVMMVMRNSAGQMVSYSTATVDIAPGSLGTAYNAEFGLPFGTYNATIFAMTTGGVAISNYTSISFPV